MTFSVGILYSAQEFLALAGSYKLNAGDFLKDPKFVLARSETVLAVLQECRWIQLTAIGEISVTDRGSEIAKVSCPAQRLRMQIEDLVALRKPPWAAKMMHGRKETIAAMPDDVHQCFSECGLLGPWDDDLTKWWLAAGQIARTRRTETLSTTGHEAERLSCQYEKERTGYRPEWISLDSSFAGFDILSCSSPTDRTPLSIEVKGSERPPSQADFSVTRHEAETAKVTPGYVIHLWFVSKMPQLFIVPFSSVAAHLPADREKGKWQQTRVPYAPFREYRAL